MTNSTESTKIVDFKVVGDCLSLVGAFAVLVSLRGTDDSFRKRLVQAQFITEIIKATNDLVAIQFYTGDPGFSCTFFSFSFSFLQYTAVLRNMCFAIVLYKLVLVPSYTFEDVHLEIFERRLHIFVFSLAFVLASLPLTTNSYGVAGPWCWITQEDPTALFWRMAVFYVPVCV